MKLELVLPKALAHLKHKTKGGKFTIQQLHKAIEKNFKWKGKYTREHELIDVLIKPLTWNSIKLDSFVMKNYTVITAYRMWAFINAEFDYVASISATEGKAKSTLALHIAYHLKQMGVNVSWDNVFFRGHATVEIRKVIDKINLEKKSLLWFDEAKAFFDKREFMNKQRIQFLKDITAQRKNQNIYLLLLGDWEELDIYFRERRLRENILVIDKGLYTSLFNTSLLGVGYDRFYMEDFIRQVRYYPFSYLKQMELLATLPSNIGFGTFPAIEGKLWERYLELKELYNQRHYAMEKQKQKGYRKRQGKAWGTIAIDKYIKKKQSGSMEIDYEPTEDKVALDDYED